MLNTNENAFAMVFMTVQWANTEAHTQAVLTNVLRISFELCKHGLHFNLFDFYLSWIMTLSFNCLAHCCKNVLHIMSLNSLITADIQRGSFIISILFVHVYEKRTKGKSIWSISHSWIVLAYYIGYTKDDQNGSYTISRKFSCFYKRKFFRHESFIKL